MINGIKSINFIFRNPHKKGYSIENVFTPILNKLTRVYNIKTIYLPYHQFGFLNYILNALYIRALNADITHITGDAYYLLPIVNGKKIVTIHDIGSILKGGKLSRIFKKLFWLDLPLYFADHVIVVSKFTKHELLNLYPKYNYKIRVVHNCINDIYFNYQPKTPSKDLSKTKILMVGTGWNKNLINAIKAISYSNYTLIIVGKINSEHKRLLYENKIQYENYYDVTQDEILNLYSTSSFLLFVSIYEGFGLPIIEAQACGLPTIVSNLQVHIEISNKSSLYVNPLSPKDIREKIDLLINNVGVRNDLIKRGLENSKKYTSEKILNEILDIYH